MSIPRMVIYGMILMCLSMTSVEIYDHYNTAPTLKPKYERDAQAYTSIEEFIEDMELINYHQPLSVKFIKYKEYER